jgi:hypothetical protein
MRDASKSRLGNDIGGILTIFGLIEEPAREMLSPKSTSVFSDPSWAVLNNVRTLVDEQRIVPSWIPTSFTAAICGGYCFDQRGSRQRDFRCCINSIVN